MKTQNSEMEGADGHQPSPNLTATSQQNPPFIISIKGESDSEY